MNNKGKMGSGWKVFLWLLAIVGGFVTLVAILGGGGTQQTISGGVVPTSSAGILCPSNGQTTVTLNVQNTLNRSASQTYDNTLLFYKVLSDGSLSFSGTSATDTTAGSVTLDCGGKYAAKVLSVSGAAGDQGRIRSILSSAGLTDASVSDGAALFVVGTKDAVSTSAALTVGAHQEAAPQFRAYDMEARAYMYQSAHTNTNTYNTTDGVNFTSTTSNNTGVAVGSGGRLHVQYEFQGQAVDQDWNDQGILVLVDGTVTVWDFANSVSKYGYSGQALNAVSDVKNTGAMSKDESLGYSAYEAVYLIPKDFLVDGVETSVFDFNIQALSGQNPAANTDDLQVDFAPRGTYRTIADNNVLAVGAVDDSSSRTQVHTLWDTRIYVA